MKESKYQPARSSRTASDTRSACWPETTRAGPRHRANRKRSQTRMGGVSRLYFTLRKEIAHAATNASDRLRRLRHRACARAGPHRLADLRAFCRLGADAGAAG